MTYKQLLDKITHLKKGRSLFGTDKDLENIREYLLQRGYQEKVLLKKGIYGQGRMTIALDDDKSTIVIKHSAEIQGYIFTHIFSLKIPQDASVS